MDNKFEKASREKLRFNTNQGHIGVEELWELSLQSLDELARYVNTELKGEQEESFIPTAIKKKSTHNALRLELLVHVINTKAQEADNKKAAAEKRAKLSQLKELAVSKANEHLASQSLEDINKQIEALEDELVTA